ncbi:MAG: sigma-70 family RNA polymerase sigma factor [Verrucomicrobiales bacterium]|nr:sigma-70 family RNA polymerase sigma factor [Verrucomicrobiales bacterium]
MAESEDTPDAPPQPLFRTTRWSVVLTAQDKSSPDSAAALETLCRAYWYPLYAFVRGSGRSPHDAQDLTQEFFARLLARDWLRVVLPEKGRFRTFLIVAMKRFLTNEWHRDTRQKRGAGQQPLSLDTARAEHRFASEPPLAPDELYERRWAMTLLDESLERLQLEFTRAGKAHEFDAMKEWLTAERGGIPYARIAAALRTTEGAARVAVHRMRKQFRQLFRQTIAETLEATGDLDAEMRHLIAVLSRA